MIFSIETFCDFKIILAITVQTLSTSNVQLTDLTDFNNSFIKISGLENRNVSGGFSVKKCSSVVIA